MKTKHDHRRKQHQQQQQQQQHQQHQQQLGTVDVITQQTHKPTT